MTTVSLLSVVFAVHTVVVRYLIAYDIVTTYLSDVAARLNGIAPGLDVLLVAHTPPLLLLCPRRHLAHDSHKDSLRPALFNRGVCVWSDPDKY